jgi:hypothetical protein
MHWKILLTFAAISTVCMGIQAQDDSDARPPVSKADIDIVKRAREILRSPAVWNRADNRQCPANEKTFSLYCALEKATQEVGGHFEHRGAAMQEARFVIDDIAPNRNYEHRLMGYNNDPTSTFADIQRVFSLLETRIAARLRDEQNGQSAPAPDLKVQIAILKRVRVLLASDATWDRNSSQECPAGAPKLGLYCAFRQASMELTSRFDGSGAALAETRTEISTNTRNRAKYEARLVDYNNDPTVTLADLQKLLQTVEDRLTKAPPK